MPRHQPMMYMMRMYMMSLSNHDAIISHFLRNGCQDLYEV